MNRTCPGRNILALRRLRLLHLDDEIRASEHVSGGIRYRGARRPILSVIHAYATSRARLDENFVARSNQLANASRYEADSIFMGEPSISFGTPMRMDKLLDGSPAGKSLRSVV